MECDKQQRLDEGYKDAALHNVLHKHLNDRIQIRTGRFGQKESAPLRSGETYLSPLFRKEASIRHIAMVATISVMAPKPFARPKKICGQL